MQSRASKLKWIGGFVLLAWICAAPATAQDHGQPAAQPTEHAPPPAAADNHAAGADHKPNPFAGDFGNVFFTLLIFLLLVSLLGKMAWKPLLDWQQSRERTIRDSLEQARQERLKAQKLLADYQAQIDKARHEATAIVEEGRRDAEVVRRRIQDEARQESDQMIARAKREVQLAADAAVKELYDRTAELAVQVAGGIIKKSLSPDEHRALVTESLERIKSTNQAKMN